ncbi:MAG: adenylyltransferase/cytidyltransferase family protein [Patescibacteria group bacterium]
MVKVYTGGVFDILHRGHIRLLSRAKVLGDFLVVGIQSDEAVCSIPGKARPILSTEERVEQMKSLPFADEVIVYGDSTTPATIDRIKPNIFVHGHDWPLQIDRRAVISYMEEHGIKLVLLPRTEGISDTQIRERVIRETERVRIMD